MYQSALLLLVMNDLNTRESWICSADVDVDWPGHSNQFTQYEYSGLNLSTHDYIADCSKLKEYDSEFISRKQFVK